MKDELVDDSIVTLYNICSKKEFIYLHDSLCEISDEESRDVIIAYATFMRSTLGCGVSGDTKTSYLDHIIHSRIKNNSFIDEIETVFISSPTHKIGWAFYLLPASRYDIIDNLEKLYERRFLKITNGDKRKADRMFIWQVSWAVIEYHKGKLLAAFLSIFGIFGFKELFKNIKGWFFHKD